MDFSILESGNPVNINVNETGIPITLTLSNGAYSLNGLTDVYLSSPSSGQALVYNGENWGNSGLVATVAGDIDVNNVSFSGVFVGTTSYVSSSPYTVSLDYTILADDDVAGGQILLDFPTTPSTGTIFNVKKLGSTANVVLSGSNVTFDGVSTFPLTLQYEAVTVVSYGSGYYII